MQQQYTKQLEKIGLTSSQALVYELLLERGKLPASILTRHLPFSRQMVYNLLDELIELSLVEKEEKKGSVTRFAATHPSGLRDVFAARQKTLADAGDGLENILPTLTSNYNIQSGKPGVQFSEGLAGVEAVLAATLEHKDEEIYTYVDTESIERYVKEINNAYVKKRKAHGIKKKILMMDSPLAREKASKATADNLTEIKLISVDAMTAVPAVLEIHNGQIAYITFTKGLLTATTLHDKTLYQLHRFLFESHWKCATMPPQEVPRK